MTTEPEFITLYHGGNNLEYNYRELKNNNSGQLEHGAGIYLISDLNIAAKYAKGGNKLYRVTIERGTRADEVMLPMTEVARFITTLPKNQKVKELKEFIYERYFLKDRTDMPAENLMNLLINYELLKPSKSAAFRQYMIDQGVDYTVSRNYGGDRNTMVVVINPDVIKKVEVIKLANIPVSDYCLDVNLDKRTVISPEPTSKSEPLPVIAAKFAP